MRVRREDPEVSVSDVRAIQVRRRWWDANVGICRVTLLGRQGRGRYASRPSGTPELADGAERVIRRRMAGGNHRRIGIRRATIHDRENPAVWVVADLEVVLVDEGHRSEAEARQVVTGFRPAGGVEFRSVDQDEPDSEASLDVEGVSVND